MLRHPVNSRLLVVMFWGSQLYVDLTEKGVGTPNPHIVQESTIAVNTSSI